MSGSFESMRWNACVHRLDLGLYPHPKEFGGNGVRNYANSKGKIPSTGGSVEVRTCNAASRRTASPTHYQLSYPSPKLEAILGRSLGLKATTPLEANMRSLQGLLVTVFCVFCSGFA